MGRIREVCGIIAVVGGTAPACEYVLEGLTVLQNRGYDSAGLVTVTKQGDFRVTKYASDVTTSDALDRLKKESVAHRADHHVGVGHTRWATHGGKTDANAHPHLDATGRIAVVHNGVIENSEELKVRCAKEGFPCISETDTEVIAQLVGYYVTKKNMSLMDAVEKAQKDMRGSWGIVVIDRQHPEEIVAAAHGSPLLVGIAADKKFIASEAAAFAKYTRQFISLKDREVVRISVKGDLASKERPMETYDNTEEVALSPEPFPHWTLKEINEQPAAIMRALNFGGRVMGKDRVKLGGLEEHREELLGIEHLVIAACGTSFHAGMFGARLMRMMRAFKTVSVVDAAELEQADLPLSAKGGLLVISQSGETKDVMRALQLGLQLDLPCLSVVNAVGSTVARTSKCGVYLNAGREVAVASTKAFTSQATVLTLISIWFAQNRGEHGVEAFTRQACVSDLQMLSLNAQKTISSVHADCSRIAQYLLDKKARKGFILGKAASHAIALEAALKIKEIAYLQTEGYAGGALKHGPFALIEPGTPLFLIILDDHEQKRMLTAAAEVHARGAYVVAITDSDEVAKDKHIDVAIKIPNNGLLSSILAILPFQLIAYELSIRQGINPDKPRNLAKAVTVD